MKEPIRLDELELEPFTIKTLAAAHCLEFPNGFTSFEDILRHWKNRGGRRGFWNLRDTNLAMIDEIQQLIDKHQSQ